MKAYWITLFLLCCAALSAGQVQLAPNPGCPNNATYCRANVSTITNTGVVPVVLGFNNGTLYGSVTMGANVQCPNSGVSANSNPGTLCFYTSTSFNPESWTYVGQYPLSSSESAAEIVFPSGSCSSYKYVYTLWGKEILRATSSSSDWNFTDVGSSNLSGLPADTGARPGSFAAANQSGTTRLFYGNYNNHQNTCPRSLLWHSDDCGSTWSSPYEFRLSGTTGVTTCQNPPYTGYSQYYHGTEVHDVNVDPANNSNIYVTVDTETADAQPLGLWKSTDGGNTFAQLTSNSSAVGIDFVFPSGMNKIFLETDGCAGAVSPPGCNWSGHLPTGSGPLMSQDEGSDPFQIAANWPTVSSGPGWGGEAYSIKLTSDQNIYLLTDTEINGRQGVWYFTPPNYDNATLLEDLAPPINNLTWNNGVATATTINAHGFASGDVIAVSGVSNSCFNNSGVAITVTGPQTFKYSASQCTPCPNCSNPTGSGGLASKTGFDFFGRSAEARDPVGDITYIYSAQERTVRPIPQAELAVILQILYENLLN